jgi:hypothetical protein
MPVSVPDIVFPIGTDDLGGIPPGYRAVVTMVVKTLKGSVPEVGEQFIG